MVEEKNEKCESAVGVVITKREVIYSEYLEREVHFDVYLPQLARLQQEPSLLLINDGQDLEKMDFANILCALVENGKIEPVVCIGIHCSIDRKMEYGTAYSADFAGRGAKAGLYTKFIFEELVPFIRSAFNFPSFREKSFAGFSLGALSALDIVWNNANHFSKVGIFSGSLWWRRKAYDNGYQDEKDRLMHLQVKVGTAHPWLKFFFQCGLLDEEADRNNNGIIDSIDDALDLIKELNAKGYKDDQIKYYLMEEGRHEVETWAKALPVFLEWGWGIKK
ncbi:MAG: Esterase [Segetibacter sp.]|nr:Esterase [Segetibacter sp.]